MKYSFINLLGETVELLDNQPTELNQTIDDIKICTLDQDVRTVIDYLSKQEVQYVTYSHS